MSNMLLLIMLSSSVRIVSKRKGDEGEEDSGEPENGDGCELGVPIGDSTADDEGDEGAKKSSTVPKKRST